MHEWSEKKKQQRKKKQEEIWIISDGEDKYGLHGSKNQKFYLSIPWRHSSRKNDQAIGSIVPGSLCEWAEWKNSLSIRSGCQLEIS